MDQYFYDIRDFDLKNTSTPWQLDRFSVATSLLRICHNPDVINQDGFNFCGQVSFLRAWLYRDPIAVLQFATKLFENGNSSIGNYQVHAAEVLLKSKYIKENPENLITSAVWMICGALADTEDDVMDDFDGNPPGGNSAKTIVSEVLRWLYATNLYKFPIENELGLTNDTTGMIFSCMMGFPGINFTEYVTVDDLIKQLEPYRPSSFGGQYTQIDVLLMINTNMFRNLISCDPSDLYIPDYQGGIKSILLSHWIMLDKPIEDLGNGQVRLSIWTGGKRYQIVLTKDEFNSNYYGSVRARPYENNKRVITPRPFSFDFFPGTVDAWYSTQWTLEIDWRTIDNVDWFTIASASDGSLPGKIWYKSTKDGLLKDHIWNDDSLNYHYHISITDPDLIGPQNQEFYIKAFNCWSDDPLHYQTEISSNIIKPDCRTETQHFRFSYFGYNSPHQIIDWGSHNGVEVKSTGSRLLGKSYPDGRMEIVGKDQVIPINLEINTPDYIASIAIALEYCYYWLTSLPFSFEVFGKSKIEVSIRRGANSSTIDEHSGCPKMTFNSNLKYEDIPLVTLNEFVNLIKKKLFHNNVLVDGEWDIPPLYVIQDALLGLDKFFPLLQSFVRHPEEGLKDEKGTAAFWAYMGLRAGDPQGTIHSTWTGDKPGTGIRFMPDTYVNFIYSDEGKDVYDDDTVFGNFVLAIASLLLAQTPTDSRFSFGSYQSLLPKPPVTLNMISFQNPLKFQSSLSNKCSMAFYILNLDLDVPNVAVSFQIDISATNAKPLLQIMLLDANDAIIDVIKTDKSQYDRTIGLRDNTVKKILIAVANRENNYNSNSYKYTLKATAVKNASDVMITRWNRPSGMELVSTNLDWDTPDIWLTSDDPKLAKDTIDVQNDNDLSVVHVRLHNFGNQDAQKVHVNLYYQNGDFRPPDGKWEAMQLVSDIIMDIPANGICEATARWFCPIRPRVGSSLQTISLAAELKSEMDLSPDNNRATKNHAWTNNEIFVWKPPEININWAVAQEDPRTWGIGVQVDGENILEYGEEFAKSVILKREGTMSQQNVSAIKMNFQVDTEQIVSMRTNSIKLRRKYKRFPPGWIKPFFIKDNTMPVTFFVYVDQNRKQGFTVLLPINRKIPIIP